MTHEIHVYEPESEGFEHCKTYTVEKHYVGKNHNTEYSINGHQVFNAKYGDKYIAKVYSVEGHTCVLLTQVDTLDSMEVK